MLERGDRSAAPAADGGRRSALLRLGALCGLALGGDVLAAVAAPKKAHVAPELLTQDELTLLGVLAELIIPRTDTPGARDVDAHRTVDHLLAKCTPAAEQAAFRAGLARIDATARTQAGKAFMQLPAPRQLALLQAADTGAAPFTQGDLWAFRRLKSYLAFAYYTSEAGATRELAYLPVPGEFKRIKMTPRTRTWAL